MGIRDHGNNDQWEVSHLLQHGKKLLYYLKTLKLN